MVLRLPSGKRSQHTMKLMALEIKPITTTTTITITTMTTIFCNSNSNNNLMMSNNRKLITMKKNWMKMMLNVRQLKRQQQQRQHRQLRRQRQRIKQHCVVRPLLSIYQITFRCSVRIFCSHILGPVLCTDSPFTSTATVTGISFTSNS